MVERTLIRPPSSQLGPISSADREAVMAASPIRGKYENVVDRESAFERLATRAAEAARAAADAEAAAEKAKAEERELQNARRYDGGSIGSSSTRSRQSDSFGESLAKVVVKELKGTTGQRIVRGILGSLFKAR
jgi:hypothetical protein